MKNSEYAYYIGILAVLSTHVWMLVYGLKDSQKLSHAWVNIAAVAGIGWGYQDNKRN